MLAIVQDRYGSADVLEVREVETPVAGAGEALVKIHAGVVSPSDVAFRSGNPRIARLFSGLRKPKLATLGDHLAGVVEAVGPGVTRFVAGDRVVGNSGAALGTHAQFKVLPENGALVRLPQDVDFGAAVGLADGFLTAMPFLRDVAGLKPGQSVLINGASGSVGTVAVMLAKAMGAEVTGVCSGKNVELVRSLGADRVIDYGRTDFTKAECAYDVVFDAVGKSSFGRCKRALKPGGVYMSTVPTPGLLWQWLWTSKFGAKRAKFAATGLRKPDEKARDLAELVQLIAAGKVWAVIDRRYGFADIRAAHAYVEQGHKVGSVVVTICDDDRGLNRATADQASSL